METQELRKVEILQNKIDNLLFEKVNKNQEILDKIEKDGAFIEDYILPLGPTSPINFEANGRVSILFNDEKMNFHSHALSQLGLKFDIPTKYVNYLNDSEWGRQLLKNIFTEHKNNIPRNKILLRTVGNEARAVLSDRYLRLDSNLIYQKFIENMISNGAKIYDAFYSETKTYMSAIYPKVFSIETENNGIVHSVFGARIANSDFGDGALDLRSFQMNVVCLNGMVSNTELKQVHLGARLNDNLNFSRRTYELDTKTKVSAVNDISNNLLSAEKIMEQVSKIKTASAQSIDIDNEIKKLSKTQMLKDEIQLVGKKLMANNPEDGLEGKATKWKLSQAITAVANDIGNRRKYELDEIAGKLINL